MNVRRAALVLSFIIPASFALLTLFLTEAWQAFLVWVYLFFSLWMLVLYRLMKALGILSAAQTVLMCLSFVITSASLVEINLDPAVLSVFRPVCIVSFALTALASCIVVTRAWAKRGSK